MNSDNAVTCKEKNISETVYEIEGKTFIVGSIYNKGGETINSILLRLMKND